MKEVLIGLLKDVECFCQEVDGRLEKTILYDLIKRECHLVNDYDIITFMNNLNHDRTKIAALAYINGLAAKEKDPNALKIYKQAAEEIYKLINLLSKILNLPLTSLYRRCISTCRFLYYSSSSRSIRKSF